MRKIQSLLNKIKRNKITVNEAMEKLSTLPYEDLGFAKIDTHRFLRRGFPEVVFGDGKTPDEILEICKRIIEGHRTLLLTRANKNIYTGLKKFYKDIKFDDASRLIYLEPRKTKKKGLILILTGGTSDAKVAKEAAITARVMGNRVKLIFDVGVAGVHRLFGHIKLLRKANVLIVIAGMEGALASVVSGLVSKPVIAVPTSGGYGASFKGIAPLLTMLNSCSPGVCVVNIDNGFGAGYFAAMINK